MLAAVLIIRAYARVVLGSILPASECLFSFGELDLTPLHSPPAVAAKISSSLPIEAWRCSPAHFMIALMGCQKFEDALLKRKDHFMERKEAENVRTVKDFYRAVAKGNLEYAYTLLAPKIEWLEPIAEGLFFSGGHHGRQLVLDEVIKPTCNKIHEFEWKPHKLFPLGDCVIVLGRETGRCRTTNTKLRARMAHVWTLRTGRPVRCESFRDTIAWREVLGQITKEPERLAA
jgi:hypothetical protein